MFRVSKPLQISAVLLIGLLMFLSDSSPARACLMWLLPAASLGSEQLLSPQSQISHTCCQWCRKDFLCFRTESTGSAEHWHWEFQNWEHYQCPAWCGFSVLPVWALKSLNTLVSKKSNLMISSTSWYMLPLPASDSGKIFFVSGLRALVVNIIIHILQQTKQNLHLV